MGASRASPQTGVYADLFSYLEQRGIPYCVLKGTHELSETLEGRGDLDLLTPPADLADIGQALLALGFKPARSLAGPSAPAQWHYFRPRPGGGWDHVHLHSAVVCSEQLRTSHLLSSMTPVYLAHSEQVNGVRVPEPGAEYGHLMLKVFNRFASLPDLALFASGRWDPWPEIAVIRSRATVDEAAQILDEAGIELSAGLLRRCDRALARGRLTPSAILLGWLVRRRLAPLRVSSWIERLVDYFRIGGERVRRKWSRRTSRVSRYGGVVVAVVGPDAVGKSTLVSRLATRFGEVYRVSVFHGGKPAPTLRTLPLRMARNWWRLVRRTPQPSVGFTSSSTTELPSLAQAVNAWALALDRRAVLAEATREAARGTLVLFDRYPSQVAGGMDGPRLAAISEGGVRGWLSQREAEIYDAFIPPDLVIRLSAPVSELLARDGTRTRPDGTDYLLSRASAVASWDMDRECRVVELTTTASPDEVQEGAVAAVWKVF